MLIINIYAISGAIIYQVQPYKYINSAQVHKSMYYANYQKNIQVQAINDYVNKNINKDVNIST